MTRYYAHSGIAADKSDWQGLREHLIAVAELAADMARPLGLSKAAYIAGLLHDLGKYTPQFQRRLEGGPSADHSTAGAKVLMDLPVDSRDKAMAELIAYSILGHHAGLPDRLSPTGACFNRRIEALTNEPDIVWRDELAVEASGLFPESFQLRQGPRVKFQFALMARMIFSCLVDADFKDTERFFYALEGRLADRQWQPLQALLPTFLADYEKHMADKIKTDTDLNRLRSYILSHVRGKADEKPGLFTLTVPTGGGKTLASLGFALGHARAHGHTRIIYAIPFTSIIDQTADIFRQIFDGEHVLEHHSAIDDEMVNMEGRRDSRDKLKLAMEDWAAPVVVTTNVQLFESLFVAKTSRARKLHNIAGSIIILDEAQTIPRPLLMPCIRVLEELAHNYGCTIVLCTATQPALDENALKNGLPLKGRELAPDPIHLAQALRRTEIRRVGEMSNEDLIVALRDEPQALIIVNSRKHALELFKEAQAADVDGLVHLTTRQYAAHRRAILRDMRTRLKDGKPCRVIATSLIEAGVDVDFPRVWRAEAGLEQVVQAAGRCNREGRRPLAEAIVTVFSAPDYPPPAEIRALVSDMQRMLARQSDLLSLAAIEDYYGEVYWRMGEGLDSKKILARFDLNGNGTDFAFRSVAEDFRMIESGMVPVIIAGDTDAEKAVEEINLQNITSGVLARKLQTYIIQVPPKARDLLVRNGHVSFMRPDLRGDQFAVLMNTSLYQPEVGLIWENAEYLAAESCIF